MWTPLTLRRQLLKFNDVTEYSGLVGVRKAAVLIPLVIINGGLYVWLTLRALHLKNDAGHVAFPGGLEDPEDENLEETSLREANEEIGLQSYQVEVLAHISPYINRRQILIVPIVGLVSKDFVPNINKDEVESAFCLPLERFLKREDHNSHKYESGGLKWIIHHFDDTVNSKTYHTWGLTANICVSLAVALFQREPEFDWIGSEQNTVEDPYKVQQIFVERFKRQNERETKREKCKL